MRHELDSWVRKILWRRAQQIIPVFLLEESHGQRSLGGYGLQCHRVRHDRSNLAHVGDCHTAFCLLLQCSFVTDITCALLSIFFSFHKETHDFQLSPWLVGIKTFPLSVAVRCGHVASSA